MQHSVVAAFLLTKLDDRKEEEGRSDGGNYWRRSLANSVSAGAEVQYLQVHPGQGCHKCPEVDLAKNN